MKTIRNIFALAAVAALGSTAQAGLFNWHSKLHCDCVPACDNACATDYCAPSCAAPCAPCYGGVNGAMPVGEPGVIAPEAAPMGNPVAPPPPESLPPQAPVAPEAPAAAPVGENYFPRALPQSVQKKSVKKNSLRSLLSLN